MYDAIRHPAHSDLIIDVVSTAEYILAVQKTNGEIPWSKSGKTDPWDHIESAMGLTVAGFLHESKNAYLWSAETQMDDGSWWSYYRNDQPVEDAYKDSNMIAYIATGVYHYYLATGDHQFLRHMWHTVRRAMDYVIGLQAEEGHMYWAKRPDRSVDPVALLTGSSSIYFSLGCAIRIASLLNKEKPEWKKCRTRLGNAIRHKQYLFDNSKSRFSMDWYYPVLCGAIKGDEGYTRIKTGWDTYVVDGWGALCVSDSPWVTMAETAELVISLAALGDFKMAEMIFSWLPDKTYDDGAFWTGITIPEKIIYTDEKTSWTGAAVLLAADILYDLTPAGRIFRHDFL